MTDKFTRKWITENSVDIIRSYQDGVLTLRGLHYQLVGRGMTNTTLHYKRVVNAMIKARWEGDVRFEVFSDHDRRVLGETTIDETVLEDEINQGKDQIRAWMNNYNGNRWENQPEVPEVWIEKKALQGVFKPVCDRFEVALAPCKGYPSLTFLNEARDRFEQVKESCKIPIILYFGDYDASGEDIPRSIKQNLWDMGLDIEVRRIALMKHQVLEMNLPFAPTKEGDSRAKNWDGLGQVELDAVDPNTIDEMCTRAIESCFDEKWHKELTERIDQERPQYKEALKDYVINMFKE